MGKPVPDPTTNVSKVYLGLSDWDATGSLGKELTWLGVLSGERKKRGRRELDLLRLNRARAREAAEQRGLWGKIALHPSRVTRRKLRLSPVTCSNASAAHRCAGLDPVAEELVRNSTNRVPSRETGREPERKMPRLGLLDSCATCVTTRFHSSARF